ncbi:hypothetical protein Zmor_008187 [Zophobas morio]|uniref:Uncharacterized protein n=1 Tax=Zophobas morio TaxID=2755281 RepID=A0AA38J3S3_9CUCU|nr:hypothetical protein Zmor_008187 [Zophobas morio]
MATSQNCLLCHIRFFNKYAFFSGIIFFDCNCHHTKTIPKGFVVSKNKFAFCVLLFLLTVTFFLVCEIYFYYGSNLNNMDPQYYDHFRIFESFGLVTAICILIFYKNRITALTLYQKLILKHRIHFSQAQQKRFHDILAYILCVTCIISLGFGFFGSFHITPDEPLAFRFLMASTVAITTSNIYCASFFKYFEVQLMLDVLQESSSKLVETLENKLGHRKHVKGVCVDVESRKNFAIFREFFSLYKSIIFGVDYLNSDLFVVVRGFYQVFVLIYNIYLLCYDTEYTLIKILHRGLTIANLTLMYCKFCSAIENVTELVSTECFVSLFHNLQSLKVIY